MKQSKKLNNALMIGMKTNEELPEPDFEEEESGYDDCQNCGREFDEIDHDYQICHHCGFDSEKGQFTKRGGGN